MSDKTYDIAVIGSGPAGEKAAIEASALGASVVIIEKGIRPGGASVITGTIPSKSLRETVKYIETLSQTEISGLDVSLKRKISVSELMHRKNTVISQRVDDIIAMYHSHNIDIIFGKATFSTPHELVVTSVEKNEEVVIRADKFVIAVGTVPYHPPGLIFDGRFILDSDSILHLAEIPKTLAVIGGGVIGCEYATIFSKLGTKVYLIDPKGTLLDFIDPDISEELAKVMENDGVVLKLGQHYEEIIVDDNEVQILLSTGETISTSAVLCASGRQGMADQLNLDICGLEVNSRCQLKVDSNYQTKIPHIYAVGDVIGFPSLVSVSNEEGRMAACHAVTKADVCRVGSDIPYGIYTIPEIGMIGLTEKQLKDQEIPFAVGKCYFVDLARGLIIGDRRGILKILFHLETHKVLGIHIFGQSAAELIHIGQAVMNLNGKVEYFVDTVFNFPTLSAAYKVAARNGLAKF